jgi:Na+-driven multidrug efflux pump
VTTYYVIYARMGTAEVAAMNIVATIDQVAFVTLIAIGSACGVLVGNKIGAGEIGEAYRYAGRTLALVAMLGLGLGAVLALISGPVLSLYRVGPEVLANARGVIIIIALSMWLRGCNFVLFIGILRSGGDTRFGFALDAGPIWVIGVPMAFLGAFVLGVPLPFVYLMAMADEFTKFCAALYRFFSRRWIHNLAHVGQGQPG